VRDPVEDMATQGSAGATDSLTLGQLKAHPAAQPKQKVSSKAQYHRMEIDRRLQTQLFDFRYDDTDTMLSELEEFYTYVDMLEVVKSPALFSGTFQGGKYDLQIHCIAESDGQIGQQLVYMRGRSISRSSLST